MFLLGGAPALDGGAARGGLRYDYCLGHSGFTCRGVNLSTRRCSGAGRYRSLAFELSARYRVQSCLLDRVVGLSLSLYIYIYRYVYICLVQGDPAARAERHQRELQLRPLQPLPELGGKSRPIAITTRSIW